MSCCRADSSAARQRVKRPCSCTDRSLLMRPTPAGVPRSGKAPFDKQSDDMKVTRAAAAVHPPVAGGENSCPPRFLGLPEEAFVTSVRDPKTPGGFSHAVS